MDMAALGDHGAVSPSYMLWLLQGMAQATTAAVQPYDARNHVAPRVQTRRDCTVVLWLVSRVVAMHRLCGECLFCWTCVSLPAATRPSACRLCTVAEADLRWRVCSAILRCLWASG
jgi:hypothetical protein